MAKVVGDVSQFDSFADVKGGQIFISVDTGRTYICGTHGNGKTLVKRAINVENGETINMTDGNRVVICKNALVNRNG